VVRRDQRLRRVVDAPDELEGPLDRGERVGWIEVRRDGRTVRRVPLVTLSEVEGAGFVARLADAGGTLLIVLFLLGIVLTAVWAVRRKRGTP
jgi:D-alanyl-D-alanine carboxypeptidase (penicillin-binding protein 5/6)